MLLLSVAALVGAIMAFGILLMLNIELIASDQHPQWVPLASLTMENADEFTTVQIADSLIQPKITLDIDNPKRSTVITYEVHKWLAQYERPDLSLDPVDDADVRIMWAVTRDGSKEPSPETAIVDSSSADWVVGEDFLIALDIIGGTGGGAIETHGLREMPNMPYWLEGGNYYPVLTANHYHFSIDSTASLSAMTCHLSLYGRLVIIDISELMFDQLDVASLALTARLIATN